MADDEPTYTVVTGKLPELLKKIRQTGVPPKATVAWLKTLGFTSSNDTTLLRVLRYIGFIDSSGGPTPAWKEYRGRDHKAVLGRAIKTGYQELYSVYPDAHEQSNSDLSHVFSTRTTSGKAVVDKMVSTFKALAGEAEFTSDGGGAVSATQESDSATQAGGGSNASPVVTHTPSTTSGLTVNINIQLTLPEAADEKTYEAFFKAMRNHLLSDAE